MEEYDVFRNYRLSYAKFRGGKSKGSVGEVTDCLETKSSSTSRSTDSKKVAKLCNEMPKIYILGGFGGAASLQIANEVFQNGRDICCTGSLGDSGDVKFTLDSHPGNGTHVTPEECIAPLKAGLLRASIHGYICQSSVVLVCIACNTMHLSLEQVKSIPENVKIVNIIDSAIHSLSKLHKQKKYCKIILWGTSSTANGNLYFKKAKEHGIDVNKPSHKDQKIIDAAIQAIKCGNSLANLMDSILSLLQTYSNGTCILLGCTELPLMETELLNVCKRNQWDIDFINCNRSLALAALEHYRLELTRPKDKMVNEAGEKWVDWSKMSSEQWQAYQSNTVLADEHKNLEISLLPDLLNNETRLGTKYVLDLGCGEGGDAMSLAKLTKYDVKILGVDFNKDFLETGREIAQKENLSDRIQFRQMDLTIDATTELLRKIGNNNAKRLFVCLGNAIGIIPNYQKAIRVITNSMHQGEKLLMVSHDAQQLQSRGIYELYAPMANYIGKIDYDMSDLPKGLFVTDSGYTSQWFSPDTLEMAICTYSESKMKTLFKKVIGMDTYVFVEKC